MSKQYVSPPLIRRPSRTLPVTILAVVLLAAGVVAIIAAIQRLQHGSLPQWVAWGRGHMTTCLLYTSPSPRDATLSRMPSSA